MPRSGQPGLQRPCLGTNKTFKIIQLTKERWRFGLFAVGCSQGVQCVLSIHKPWAQSLTRQQGTSLTNSVVPRFPQFLAIPHSYLAVCSIPTSPDMVRDTSPQETGKFSPTLKEFFKLVLFEIITTIIQKFQKFIQLLMSVLAWPNYSVYINFF